MALTIQNRRNQRRYRSGDLLAAGSALGAGPGDLRVYIVSSYNSPTR